jgi:hypothetical protein
MVDTPNGTDAISMNDAISLLNTPTEDTVTDERNEVEDQPQQPEAEARVPSEDQAQDAPEDDDYDDEADDGEDAYEGDDDDEDYDEEPAEKLYTVKVDGKEVEVNLEEALKGYQRQEAFTKRSMELAEQRKAFAAEAAETKQLRDAYAQQLELLQAQLQQTNLTEEPDWAALKNEGYSTDDIFFAKTEWDKQQKQAYEVAMERQRIGQQQAQEQEAQLKQHLQNQRVEMLERIPEWRNDDTREFERKEVIKYAQKRVGFSEEEISSASDARAIELLYKAWKWDNLMEKKPTTKKRTRQAPKMAKAGQPATKREVANRSRRKAREQFEKAGTVDAAVQFLMGK